MRKVLASVLFLLMASALALKAQNVSDLIISEVLARPDSTGILDDYGRRSGWIELYNKSTGTVNFGGCYLTDDPDKLRKSIIPKSDLRTKLGPRQTVFRTRSPHMLLGVPVCRIQTRRERGPFHG